ncbi:lipopolysaccharide biosynthesis protein [Mucilaginibacter robiniae]|uniref:Lipopolysaccharide biosynthesis protein n=1 Tax=Mucilaginibacter robiniae TaxID=2728022 RepID=A0A7L5E4C3_9SPHI|nr:glycosyl transferase family 90 [Mucilaginibacter robiniae]QJD95196.1 lipopolysaccharide biosynthesis protein [Mucilaginibacter robiniae]
MFFQNIVLAIRKNKLLYYAKNFLQQRIPAMGYEKAVQKKQAVIQLYDEAYITDRVNYYNKLNQFMLLGKQAVALREIWKIKSPKAYRFDTMAYTRYFNPSLKANFTFGDVITTPTIPTLQKSRPVASNNQNAILLKLDKKRHFFFIHDRKTFVEKKNMMIGRASVVQPHRIRFMEMYYNHPLCDLGQVNREGGNAEWLKPKISITAHLDYKFILSLEGHDVATNLKWIMSSNSIAVMPKPKYETWFMEGRLIGNHHYIQIKDDYSDLEERLQYYLNHPNEAEAIIVNAHQYIEQFFNTTQEDLISLLVLQKYFKLTGQVE